jgi:hypothetical protein
VPVAIPTTSTPQPIRITRPSSSRRTCTDCHNQTAWAPATSGLISFYPAICAGAHTSASCNDCHQGNYSNPPNTCAGCHTDDYNNTTNREPNRAAQQLPTSLCGLSHARMHGLLRPSTTASGRSRGRTRVRPATTAVRGTTATHRTPVRAATRRTTTRVYNPNHPALNLPTTCENVPHTRSGMGSGHLPDSR